MQGYQVIFFTQCGRMHGDRPIADWLLQLARELDLRGGTLIPAGEGLGHDRRLHATGFFELADQPEMVLLAVTGEECERLFARLAGERLSLFYLKTVAEFGTVGHAGARPGVAEG